MAIKDLVEKLVNQALELRYTNKEHFFNVVENLNAILKPIILKSENKINEEILKAYKDLSSEIERRGKIFFFDSWNYNYNIKYTKYSELFFILLNIAVDLKIIEEDPEKDILKKIK